MNALRGFAERLPPESVASRTRAFALVLATLFLPMLAAHASGHREAPLISADPFADNTDLYAFRSPDLPDTVTIIANFHPLQRPQSTPNVPAFGENIRYEIHIDNDINTSGDDIIYRFTFTTVHQDPTTIFNVRFGLQNRKQTYTLERSTDGGSNFTTIVSNGVVPPNNLGPQSISGASGLNTTYDALFNAAILTAATGEQVFCGPTEDPYFADNGGFYDLGDAPRATPRDSYAGLNVSTIAIQADISTLQKNGQGPGAAVNLIDGNFTIGVYASTSRQQVRTLNGDGTQSWSGNWIQISRVGMPLTNDVVTPIGNKDFWNALNPYDELGDIVLDPYFHNPELGLYMDNSLFGTAFPAWAPLRVQRNSLSQIFGGFDFGNGNDGLYPLKGSPAVAGTALDDAIFGTLLLPAPGSPRSVDLWLLTHTGVPNLEPYQLATGKTGNNPLTTGKPFVNNFLPNGGDMLRLNMAVPPTPRASADFSTLGLVQAAILGLTDPRFNTTLNLELIPNMDGFPNGRRLEDDVVRVQMQMTSGFLLAAIGFWYDDFDTAGSPITPDLLGVIGFSTGVESNSTGAFGQSFPYLHPPAAATGVPVRVFANGFE